MAIEIEDYTTGFRLAVRGDTAEVDLIYPRSGEIQHVEVGLEDTRSTDSIRIHFDFERNGWSVEQASVFGWDADDTERDPDWQEVAFIEAWAREVRAADE